MYFPPVKIMYFPLVLALIIWCLHAGQTDSINPLPAKETFEAMPSTTTYTRFSLGRPPKKHKYLEFLYDVTEDFKNKSPKTGAFRGSCDEKVNTKVQNTVMHAAYSKLHNNSNTEAATSRQRCQNAAVELCNYTHPYMHVNQTGFAPRWLLKSLDNEPLPQQLDLACYASHYGCCMNAAD